MRRLLIRPGAIGDCILALPALEFLKAGYTEVWIPSVVVPLVQFADRVSGLLSTGVELVGVGDRATPPEFKEKLESFDEVVSWYGANRPQFREALQALNTRCIFHQALPASTSALHATDFYAEQVGAPLGLIPHIETGPCEPRNCIAIHPFSGSARKNWPLDRYLDLASRSPCPVEWIAGPEEDLPGALRFENLLHLARHIAGSRLYIGNDSGITHLAAAGGAKTVALFGPTNPNVWTPRGPSVTVLPMLPTAAVSAEVNRLLDLP